VLLMLVLGSRGLEGGATFGTILAIVSIVPMVIILLGAFAVGMFDFSNITTEWTTPDWTWSLTDIVLLFGCFGLAQWSACAWETAAIYGPEYKEPGRDVPKALFGCGIICLILYFFVSMSVFGSLGATGIDRAGYASLVPISEEVFGHAGSYVALGLLIVAMILIIQTGFLGSSRTLHSMAGEKNLPGWFGRLNDHGMPVNAMIFVGAFNLLLTFAVGLSYWEFSFNNTLMTILSASAMGYCIANGIALAAYVKTKSDPRFKDLERPFKAPAGWKYVIMVMTGVQFLVWLPCLVYWSYVQAENGYLPAILGAVIILVYIPVWYLVQGKSKDVTSAAPTS